MRVLVACEFSGTVRRAFRSRGHDAWSCDLEPSDDKSPNHIQCDALFVLDRDWDLVIAHPPCTYLANSGVRWLHERPGRWSHMEDGASFFRRFLGAAPKVCIENPVIHKYAREIIGRGPDQTIQPWQFGHGETKRICLWLENLPPLKPTNIVEGREQRIWKMSPSSDRGKQRSVFYSGIAEAMADQWGM